MFFQQPIREENYKEENEALILYITVMPSKTGYTTYARSLGTSKNEWAVKLLEKLCFGVF